MKSEDNTFEIYQTTDVIYVSATQREVSTVKKKTTPREALTLNLGNGEGRNINKGTEEQKKIACHITEAKQGYCL